MYQITNRGDSTEVVIYDDIGEGFFGGISAKQVRSDIAEIETASINLRLNSAGGSVHEGFAIANSLREHPARIVVDVDSLAASIASYIAVAAGDEIRMAENAFLMIHNAWTVTAGDAAEMRKTADILDKHNDVIVAAYHQRTNLMEGEVRSMMDAETWFTAEEAVEAGLADSVVEDATTAAAAWFDPSRFRNTPQTVLDNMSTEPKRMQARKQTAWMRNIAKERLRLTKLRR